MVVDLPNREAREGVRAQNGTEPPGIGMALLAAPGVLSEVALHLPPGVPYEELVAIGAALSSRERNAPWLVGDFVNYLYGPTCRVGEAAAQVVAESRIHPETAQNASRVCLKIDEPRRRGSLSFGHHDAVYSLCADEQDSWLSLATENEWSRDQLRTAIREDKRLRREAVDLGQAVLRGGVARVEWRDALDFLGAQPPGVADLLLTDPPYSTHIADINAFAAAWLPPALATLSPAGRAYICVGAYLPELYAYAKVLMAQRDFTVGTLLVWTYRNTIGPSVAQDYALNWQAILYLYGPEALPLSVTCLTDQFAVEDTTRFAVQDIAAPDGRTTGRLDAWEKPPALAERLIRHSTQPGAIVLDPFAGTGTFVAAAGRLGRRGYGSEIDQGRLEFCERRGIEVIRA